MSSNGKNFSRRYNKTQNKKLSVAEEVVVNNYTNNNNTKKQTTTTMTTTAMTTTTSPTKEKTTSNSNNSKSPLSVLHFESFLATTTPPIIQSQSPASDCRKRLSYDSLSSPPASSSIQSSPPPPSPPPQSKKPSRYYHNDITTTPTKFTKTTKKTSMFLTHLVAYKTRLFLLFGALSSYILSITFLVNIHEGVTMYLDGIKNKQVLFDAVHGEDDSLWHSALYPERRQQQQQRSKNGRLSSSTSRDGAATVRIWDISNVHDIDYYNDISNSDGSSSSSSGKFYPTKSKQQQRRIRSYAYSKYRRQRPPPSKKTKRRLKHLLEYIDNEWDAYYSIFDANKHAHKYTGKVARTKVIKDKEGCIPVSKWHLNVPNTCNMVHEIDMSRGVIHDALAQDDDDDDALGYDLESSRLKYKFSGAARQAWLLGSSSQQPQQPQQQQPPLILKTLRWEREFTPEQSHRQRRDALATERLTSSPYVVSIYGYCSTSVLNEFADGGDFYHRFLPPKRQQQQPKPSSSGDNTTRVVVTLTPPPPAPTMSSLDKLIYARDAALGLAAIHSIDGPDHVTTMVHHDIRRHNFLMVNGKIKYHDFNQAQLLRWNPDTEEKCGFVWEEECGLRDIDVYPRAPEECRNRIPPKSSNKNKSPPPTTTTTTTSTTTTPAPNLSERVEIYRLGTFMFKLLTDQYPYKFEPEGSKQPFSKVLSWILDTKRQPTIPSEYERSSDPAVRVLVRVIRKALEKNAEKRISARSLAETLDMGVDLVMMMMKTKKEGGDSGNDTKNTTTATTEMETTADNKRDDKDSRDDNSEDEVIASVMESINIEAKNNKDDDDDDENKEKHGGRGGGESYYNNNNPKDKTNDTIKETAQQQERTTAVVAQL